MDGSARGQERGLSHAAALAIIAIALTVFIYGIEMRFSRLTYGALIIGLLALSGCGRAVDKRLEFGSQYWQRSSVSEGIYMQGPKAQQALNHDIADCVTELRELERLGELRNAIPTDLVGRVLDPDDKEIYGWDSPERDGALLAEHTDYKDFEGCMLAKGWERVEYVPYNVRDRAHDNFLRAQGDYSYQSRIGREHRARQKRYRQPKSTNPYGDLNE